MYVDEENSTNKEIGLILSNFPAPKRDLQISEWNDLILKKKKKKDINSHCSVAGHGSWRRVSWTGPGDHQHSLSV